MMHVPLLTPPRYHPFESGRYDVKAGLHRFGKDFGNGTRDKHVFQRDRHYDQYVALKRHCLARDPGRYYATHDFDDGVRQVVCDFIDARLRLDRPDLDDETLNASPTGDRFADLALLVQEDLCVVRLDGDRDWLAAAHVCFPNFWGASHKVGKNFAAIHEPVAHVEPITSVAAQHVRGMTNAVGGMVRFAWGITFDDRLDHHPDDEPAREPAPPHFADAHVRVERQTIWGLPTAHASLFTIRTYLYRVADLSRDSRGKLACAIESMSPQARLYKGLSTLGDPLVRWLRADAE